MEKYPVAAIILNYDDDENSLAFGQHKEACKALTKDDILKAYKSDQVCRCSFERNDVGCTLYVFSIKYKENFTAAQPITLEFKFDGVVPADINGYAFVLTNRLVSMGSDRQRHFHKIQVILFKFLMTLSFRFILNYHIALEKNFEKTKTVKINDKSQKYILRGEGIVRNNDRISTKSKERQQKLTS